MSFDLAVFSNQSCVTGTQLLPKDSHPRKYCRNLYRLIFQRLYPKTNRIAPGTSTGRLRAAYMRNSVSGHSSRPLPQRRQRRFPALAQDRFASEARAGRPWRRSLRNSVSGHSCRPLPQRRLRRSPALAPRQICIRSPRRNPKGGIQPQSRPGALSRDSTGREEI